MYLGGQIADEETQEPGKADQSEWETQVLQMSMQPREELFNQRFENVLVGN